MKEIRKKKIEDTTKFSLRFKIIACLLATAFIFQTMSSINWHTYSSKGVVIHRHDCTNPIHVSYYCQKVETINH